MRPIRLELRGFGSFRDDTTFDFEGIDFFALVGPTGNGKSTVIDAIGFALYGKVPRHDERSTASSIVSLGAIEARVRLEFEAGGTRYVAVRTVKLRNDKPKQDVRLETIDGTVIAAQVREFNAAIEGILGMPFDDFTRCVALPQGEFQKFLHEEPRERRAVLVRLLNLGSYEVLGRRARDRASELTTTANVLQQQLDQLAVTESEATDLEPRLAALTELAAAVDAAIPADQERARVIDACDAELATIRAQIERLNAIAVPATLTTLDERLQHTVDALAAAVKESEEAAVAIDRLDAEHAAALAGGDTATLTAALRAHEELARINTEITEQRAQTETARAAAETAQAALDAAKEALAAASAAVEAARNANRAHALREHLHAGDQCPVCEQPVAVVPPLVELGVTSTQHEESAARETVSACERAATAARDRATAATSTLTQLERTATKLAEQVASAPPVAELTAALERLASSDTALTAARRAHRAAVEAERKHRDAVQRERDALVELEAAFDRQRDSVAALDPPPRRSDELAANWAALASWAPEALRAQQAKQVAEQQRSDDAAAAREAERARVSGQAEAVGVSARDLVTLASAVASAIARTEAEIVERTRREAQRGDLAAQVAAAREAQQVAELLGTLLRNNQFIGWLVEEALATLIASASHTLFELSGGQYSLRHGTNADFEIVDHTNADAARSVRSLSGGETFQASLALALALSDQLADLAARGAPKLEAIFLDEGFGTLDPESLDTVATTIEALGTSGRMVGIVTHVRDLALRVPVRFEITKVGNRSQVEVVTS